MNLLKLFIISILSLIAISGGAQAFTDSFEDNTFNAWDVVSGTASILPGSGSDSGNWAQLKSSAYIQKNITTNTNYWSYYFNASSSGDQFYYRNDPAGSANRCLLTFTGVAITATNAGTCSGLTAIVPIAGLAVNDWYHMIITDQGSTMNYKLYDDTGALINEQNVADTTLSTPAYNSIKLLTTSATGGGWDNIEVSEVSSSTSTSISFAEDHYFVNDDAIITWTISETSWTDIFYFKSITLEWFDGTTTHNTNLVNSPTQTGTYAHHMDTVGTYTVRLNQRLFGLGALEVLDYDTTITSQEAQSYITANSTGFMRVPFNISYNIGYSILNYTSELEIIGTNANTGALIEWQVIDASLGNTGAVTMQQTGVKVWPVGRYTLKLYDLKKDQVLDTKYINIVNNPGVIDVMLFNSSNISTDRLTYFINDYMTVDFIVSDADFVNYTIRADIYNYDNAITTKQFFTPFTYQAGEFETLVNSKINMQCDRGTYCWFDVGNNTIRLVTYNDTYSNITAFYNFTVASTTVDGWGLSLSSNNITTTDELTMKVIVPTGSTGILKIRDAGFNPNATSIYQTSVNEGTQTYKTTITRVNALGVGYYEVEIIDASNNVVKMHLPLTVRKISAITTPVSMQTQTDNFLSSAMLPALILIMMFAGAGVLLGGVAGLMIGFSAGFIFCSIFGLVPMWSLFLFAIIVITVFAITMGKGITGGQ